MADFKFKFEVDANGAIANIDEVTEQTKATTRTMADLRKELKQVTSDLAGVEDGSEAFVTLTQRAGALKNEINDITAAVNANAGPALDNLAGSAGNLQGALTSLDFPGATRAVKGLAGQVSQLNFGTLTKGVQEFGKSLAALGRSLLTNPIFLLAAAIGGIVAATLAWRDSVNKVDAALQAQLETQQQIVDARLEALETLTGSTEQLKLQGKSQREILRAQQQAADEAIQELQTRLEIQKQIKDEQVESARRNQEIFKGIINAVSIPIQLLLGAIDKVAAFVGKDFGLRDQFNEFTSTLLFDPDKVEKEGDETIKAIEKQLAQLRESRARYQNQINDIDRTAFEKRKAELEKELADAKRIEDERLRKIREAELEAAKIRLQARQDLQAQIEAIEEEQFLRTLSQQDRELLAVQDLYFQLTEEATSYYDRLISEATAAGLDITDIVAERESALTTIEEEEAFKRAEINQKFLDERIEQERQAAESLNQFRIESTAATISALQSLNEAFAASNEAGARKAFEINKALSIAQAIQSTYQGANAIFAAAAANPKTVLFPAQPFITAGIAITSGLANVVRIARTKFGDTGFGGGGSRPSFGGAGSTGAPQPGFAQFDPSLINNRPQQPRAYVLASDVTSQTEAAQRIEDRARL